MRAVIMVSPDSILMLPAKAKQKGLIIYKCNFILQDSSILPAGDLIISASKQATLLIPHLHTHSRVRETWEGGYLECVTDRLKEESYYWEHAFHLECLCE
ncbi:hypothetical protein ILYODFUR_002819 [Ilyodon furcidens]|uniref:Uncharacterized protein n=1 Tax=Ilyodon furcidens TaxID=33524 RepID=A0ABV0VAJ7_9TELE